MQLPIVFNDRYQLHTKLGEGGLAEVYLARDLALGRSVAVKLLRAEYTTDPTFLVRFHREAQSAAALNNSNVVSVYDFGQDHNRPYIVMEYVAGEDLRTILNRGLLTIPQAIQYGIEICSAVGMAHRRGMVHGDLKPGNILISPENRAKVTDFGLARALGESAMDDGELVWGTPAYFAPEQAAGDRVMPATDVYAIGIILYEMLTGTVPFKGNSDQEIARKQLYEHPAPMSDVSPRPIPPELEAIVRRALAKEPAARFHSADQLQEALFAYQQQSQSGHTVNVPRWQGEAPAPARTIDWIAIGLGILAVLALMGLIPLWVQVYRTHFKPDAAPQSVLPTPLPTPAPDEVRVPLLTGFSQVDAESILQGLGLNMVINGYEVDPTLEPFAVVKQSVPPGMPLRQGSTVYVTLSRGKNLIEVPQVTGFQFSEAEKKLKESNLRFKTTEVWSLEPPGTVLEQSPAGQALLSENAVITLKISAGTKVAVGANFDNQIMLVAYELPKVLYKHDDTIPLTLYWQAIKPPRQNYDILLQLTTPDGQRMAEYQSNPAHGTRPTLSWLASQQIVDAYKLIIPENLSAGAYQLRLAWVDPQSNAELPIISSGGLQTENKTLILQEIRVN